MKASVSIRPTAPSKLMEEVSGAGVGNGLMQGRCEDTVVSSLVSPQWFGWEQQVLHLRLTKHVPYSEHMYT